MSIQLGSDIRGRDGARIGTVSRLIANQSDRQIHAAVLRLNEGREVAVTIEHLRSEPGKGIVLDLAPEEMIQLSPLDIGRYYALHPVEWQEEWGAVEGEILPLYPPLDKDPGDRRRFIIGSAAIIGEIAASLVYPIYPLTKGLPRLWTRLRLPARLEVDSPVFISYQAHRIEGYLEETIPKGVCQPSAALARQVAARPATLDFPDVDWQTTRTGRSRLRPSAPISVATCIDQASSRLSSASVTAASLRSMAPSSPVHRRVGSIPCRSGSIRERSRSWTWSSGPVSPAIRGTRGTLPSLDQAALP